MINRLNLIYSNSKSMEIDSHSKIVIMSDCHRGTGDNYDNFLKNRDIFQCALEFYYENDFTYIELGDGDEMWEVDDYQDIIQEHIHTFQLLKKFHEQNRLIMIYGNHDIFKRSYAVLKKFFYFYKNNKTEKEEELLNGLKTYESYLLKYKGYDIFLVHGHQVDILNSSFWKLSRFLVRHIWKNLERVGMIDPTSAAKNYSVNKRAEKRLEKWSLRNHKILISGHTHRPIFPKVGQSLYFNDGSCVHPNGITCIEIENGQISLVKWILFYDGVKFVGKRIYLEKTEDIEKFFPKKLMIRLN